MEFTYTQDRLDLHQELASGDSDQMGKFRICTGVGATIYVEFDNLKGQIPKIELSFRVLITAAYDYAKKEKLLKDSKLGTG